MKRKEKLIGLFMVLFAMISVNAWGHSTHYGKVTVNSTSTGNGSVYIGTSNTDTSGKPEETWDCGGNDNGDSKTYYLFAKADDGYEFTGWTGDGTSTDNPYAISVKATSTNSGSPTTKNYTANFRKIEIYYTKGQAEIYGSAGGSVYVSKVSGNFDGATSSATNAVQTGTPSQETYYFKAEPFEGYKFDGWYTNADCTEGRNTNSEISADVTSNSTDAGNPTTVTRYAKFVPYYYAIVKSSTDGVTVTVDNLTPDENNKVKSESKNITATFSINAAADKVVFWYNADGNFVSNANPYKCTIEGSTIDNPVSTVNLTAVVEDSHWEWVTEEPSASQFYIRNTVTGTFITNASTTMTSQIGNACLFTLEGNGTYKLKNQNNKYLTWNTSITDMDMHVNNNSGQSMTFDMSNDAYKIRYNGLGNYYLYLTGKTSDATLTKGDNTNSGSDLWQLISPEQKQKFESAYKAYSDTYSQLPKYSNEDAAKLSDAHAETYNTPSPANWTNVYDLTEAIKDLIDNGQTDINTYDNNIDNYNQLKQEVQTILDESGDKLSAELKSDINEAMNNVNGGNILDKIEELKNAIASADEEIDNYDNYLDDYLAAKQRAQSYSGNTKLSPDVKNQLTSDLSTYDTVNAGTIEAAITALNTAADNAKADVEFYDSKSADYTNALNAAKENVNNSKIAPETKTALNTALTNYAENKVNASNIEAAITALTNANTTATTDIQTYDDNLPAYNAAKEAANAYSSDVIIAQNTALKNRLTTALNTTVNAGNIVETTEELKAVKQACEEFLANINGNNPANVTGFIKNPGCENTQITGLFNWTRIPTEWSIDNIKADSENAFGNYLFRNNSNGNSSLSQTINNIPNGCYEVGVQWQASQDIVVNLSANENSVSVTGAQDGWHDLKVMAVVTDGTLTITATSNVSDDKWFNLDNFTLSYLGETDEVVLNIKTNCYGTFVAPFDVTLPNDVKAFGASSPSDDEVVLSEITLNNQLLPAGTPVIVRMNDKSAKTQTYYGPKATGTVTENGLLGFYENDIEITTGSYVLQDQGKGQMFYVVGTPLKSAKNRCCLPGTGTGAKVLSISFVENEETAVGSVSTGASVEGYYSLNGAKLSAPKSGVNIVKMSDGTVKKILVK